MSCEICVNYGTAKQTSECRGATVGETIPNCDHADKTNDDDVIECFMNDDSENCHAFQESE